ncbi:MAG: GNAT family N-acetyltransferase [Actinomycetota bacterium]
MTIEIRELTTDEEFRRAYPVMHELRTHLGEDAYMTLLADMVPRGYRLFALEADGDIAALAGIARRVNFYYLQYIWVFDLITAEKHRSKGYGLRLLSHIEDLARADGCDTVALSSAFHRVDAHRFYREKALYEQTGYGFVKKL